MFNAINYEKKKKKKEKEKIGIDLPKQESNRTLGEKENNKYLAIFEVDTIKQVETKEK